MYKYISRMYIYMCINAHTYIFVYVATISKLLQFPTHFNTRALLHVSGKKL